MKKYVLYVLTLVLMVSLCACSIDKQQATDDEDVQELTQNTDPKGIPTAEHILNQMILSSNESIRYEYSEMFINEELTTTYFFEEGKYGTTIYEGEIVDDGVYTCIAVTERSFEYVWVQQVQRLSFVFDTDSYEWILYSDEIISQDVSWEILGELQPYIMGAAISFETMDRSYGEESACNSKVVVDDKVFDFTVDLGVPSSKRIVPSYNNIGDLGIDPISINLRISPDKIWCYDWYYEISSVLEFVDRKHGAKQPSFIGLRYVADSSAATEYISVAEKFLTEVTSSELQLALEHCSPGITAVELVDWIRYLPENLPDGIKLYCAVLNKDEHSESYDFCYEKCGLIPDEIAVYESCSTLDSGEGIFIIVQMAKVDGKIYVWRMFSTYGILSTPTS